MCTRPHDYVTIMVRGSGAFYFETVTPRETDARRKRRRKRHAERNPPPWSMPAIGRGSIAPRRYTVAKGGGWLVVVA